MSQWKERVLEKPCSRQSNEYDTITSRPTSVLFIVWPKCTLAASHAAPWWVTVSMPTGPTDGQTDSRQTVALLFPPDAVSVILEWRWRTSTSASDRFNLLIVALSETSQFVVHHDTQVAAAVARVFHAHVSEVQVPFNHTFHSRSYWTNMFLQQVILRTTHLSTTLVVLVERSIRCVCVCVCVCVRKITVEPYWLLT